MVAVIVGASLLGYFNAARQTPQYSSTATLLYGRPLNMSDPLSSGSGYVDPTQQQLDVEGVGTVIEGPDIIQRVTKAVGAAAMASTTVTATAVMPSDARNYTNTAIITAVSANPQQSATVANAYAAAFVADRRDQQKVQVQQAEAVMRGEANRTPHGSDDYILLEGRLRDLQILEATLTGDFRLVKPATPASHPFAPKPFRSAHPRRRYRDLRGGRRRLPARAAQHADPRLPRDGRDPALAGHRAHPGAAQEVLGRPQRDGDRLPGEPHGRGLPHAARESRFRLRRR